MQAPVRTLIALDGVDRDRVADSLPTDRSIAIVGIVEGIEASARAIGDTSCEVLVVACAGYSERALLLIESAVRQDPERPVLVLSEGSPNGFVRRVFEVGADDILTLPTDRESTGFAIHQLVARRQTASGRGRTTLGRLVVVLGPKGGTGKTLTATNLAVALQTAGERVALVDLDLQFGDVSLCMGVDPTRTFHDLALTGSVEPERVPEYLVDHTSGVKVLVAPHRPDQASAITVEAVREVYSALRHTFGVVVVDTPPGFTAEVIASIDMSTDLVVVGMLDALSLKNTKLGLETLDLMGYDSTDIRLLLNRAGTRVGIPPEAVSAVLGRTPDVEVPSDREIPRTINEGAPIVLALPESEPATAFRKLAAFYLDPDLVQQGEQEAVATAAPASTGRRIFGRKRG